MLAQSCCSHTGPIQKDDYHFSGKKENVSKPNQSYREKDNYHKHSINITIMFIFIHNLIIIIVDINPPCILILIKVGWAPLSRDGQGVELCRESTNFHPTPHWAWTTLLMYHTTYTPIPHHTPPNATLLPAATPISINSSPNLGLEPNPQTLTSGQSLNSSALNISICTKIWTFG